MADVSTGILTANGGAVALAFRLRLRLRLRPWALASQPKHIINPQPKGVPGVEPAAGRRLPGLELRFGSPGLPFGCYIAGTPRLTKTCGRRRARNHAATPSTSEAPKPSLDNKVMRKEPATPNT